MKSISLMFLAVIFFSCGNKETCLTIRTPSYKIIQSSPGIFDTINFVDAKGLKQGVWFEDVNDTIVYKNDTMQNMAAVVLRQLKNKKLNLEIKSKPLPAATH